MRLFNKVIPTEYGLDKKRVENNHIFLSSLATQDVVFAGDSITWLFPIDELIKVKAVGRGISGDTSDQLLRRWNNTVNIMNPKLIILLIGVNDIAHRREIGDISNDIFACIDKAINYNKDIKIILEAVYPTDNLPRRRNSRIQELNALLAERVKSYKNVTYVDMFDELLGEDKKASKEFFDDGLHPNAKGFKFIADKLNPIIKKVLE